MNITSRIHEYLSPKRTWYQRPLSNIRILTVHHTALVSSQSNDQLLSQVAQIHQNHGWPGLSYHEMIMPDGTVYFINKFEDVTWHDGHNWDSYGICLQGYFHQPYNNNPTQAQLESLRQRLDFLCTQMPAFPADQDDVLGHRDRMATACPGDTLYPNVYEYRHNKGNVSWGKKNNLLLPYLQIEIYPWQIYQRIRVQFLKMESRMKKHQNK